MTLSDLTQSSPQRHNIGEAACASLRALRSYEDWPRFVGTCRGVAWTWHHETEAMLRAWLLARAA